MKFSAGQSFEPDKLDFTAKCALILTKSAITKTCSIKAFKLSQNVASSISFNMKNLNVIGIAVRV